MFVAVEELPSSRLAEALGLSERLSGIAAGVVVALHFGPLRDRIARKLEPRVRTGAAPPLEPEDASGGVPS